MDGKTFRSNFEVDVNADSITLRVVAILGLLLAFVMLLSQATLAQLPTGTILGVVKDSSGAVVPGATVTIQSTETNQTRTATTDSSGAYRVNALPVGHYVIKIEHSGFRTETQTGLNLEVGQEAVIDIALQVGTAEQTVQVTGEAQQVNTTNSTLGGVVSEQTISDLPLNGRNYVDLTLLQPGITQHKNLSNSGGNQPGTVFSSNGAPFQSNSYMLDGATLVNTFGTSGASGTGNTLGVDGIREYKVVTNNQSAEYGMTMGSQTVLVSKSGTNGFHGTGFEFLRNQVLDAANYYDVPLPANGFKRTPEFRRNNFGGALGGPVRKDKTFFHVAYEGLRESIGQTIVSGTIPTNCFGLTNNPCATSSGNAVKGGAIKILPFFPQPNLLGNGKPLVGPCLNNNGIGCSATYPFNVPITENWGQGRLDHTFSSADTAFARYTFDDSYFQQGLGYQPFTQTQGTRSQFVTLSENHVFSAGLLNTARFSFSRTAAHINSESDFAPFDFNMIAGQTAPGMGTIQITNITTSTVAGGIGPASTKPTYPIQNVFTWSDDVFYVKGKHSFKFGTLINHYQQNLFRFSNTRGAFKSSSIQQFLAGSFSTVSVNLFPNLAAAKRYYQNDTIGFYAQDDFKVLPNLTLNLGLRYEMATVVSDSHGINLRADPTCAYPCAQTGQLYENPSLHNFGPRIGFAWDVMGDGKTSVRGGGALMYDIETLGETLSGGIGQFPYGSALSLGTTPFLTLPIDVSSQVTSGQNVGTGGVNFHLKQPKLYQWNLTVERQLPWTMALQVSYVGSRGIHLLQDADSNPYPFTIKNGQPFWDAGTVTNAPGFQRLVNPTWGNFPAGGTGDSIYHALEVGVTKRVTHGLQFQSSYTYSKLIDDGDGQAPSQTTSTTPIEISVLDLRLDRGLASFDARHNYRFNTIYNLPTTNASNSFVRGALNGWWAAAIFSAQSGTPFSPSISNDRSRSSGSGGLSDLTRPDWAPGRNAYNATHGVSSGCALSGGGSIAAGTPLGGPGRFFDPCAFVLTPLGYMGNVGRNSLIGPGLMDLDFSLVKDTSVKWLGEAGKVEFRAEIFNIMNHPNFAQPARTVFSGPLTTGATDTLCPITGCQVGLEAPQNTAGVITSTASGTTQTQSSGNSRQIQFGLKVVF